MARATIKFKATGVGGGRMNSHKPSALRVGGGRMNSHKPSAPRVARLGKGRVTTNGRSKA